MSISREIHNPYLPACFTLASGIIILTTSFLFYFWHTEFSGIGYIMSHWFEGYMPFYSTVGLICGGIITAGGFMIYHRPFEMRMCGWIVLIASVVSFFGLLGVGIGPMLGIIGGAVAIARGHRIQQLR